MRRRKKTKSRAEKKLPIVDKRPLYYIRHPFGPNGTYAGKPADRVNDSTDQDDGQRLGARHTREGEQDQEDSVVNPPAVDRYRNP